ncbi:MAG: nuclear transport factor 2 family protein [Kofleriaceae bacterium]
MTLSADDRLAIHELMALHGHLTDDRRDAELDLLLTEDAAYDVTEFGLGVVTGLPALRALFEARPGAQPLGHHVTNVIVNEAADGTVGVRSKGLSVMPNGTAGSVVYDDVVTKTAAGWRISRRKVITSRPTSF